MNEETLKTIVEFNNLPETDEIKEIKRQYLKNEISAFEFYALARGFMEDVNDHSDENGYTRADEDWFFDDKDD